jgi:site-specific recombinase XerD
VEEWRSATKTQRPTVDYCDEPFGATQETRTFPFFFPAVADHLAATAFDRLFSRHLDCQYLCRYLDRKKRAVMANVKFHLVNTHLSPPHLIMLRFPFGQTNFTYSTGEKSFPKDWDKVRCRARKSHPHADNLNALLDKLVYVVRDCEITCKREGNPLSKAVLRQALDLATGKVLRDRQTVLTFVEAMRERKGNHAAWRNLKYQLTNFVTKHRRPTDFESIDTNYLQAFEEYLLKQGLKDNYVAALVIKFREMMKAARREGITQNRKYEDFKGRAIKSKSSKVTLTLPELKRLNDHGFDSERLQRIADAFFIACTMGLRYSDWGKVDLKANIRIVVDNLPFLEIPMSKTGKVAYVPVIEPAKMLLEKYGGRMPLISRQKTSDYLKEAMKAAGIDGDYSRQGYRAGRLEYAVTKKSEEISTHSARHSFITNLLSLRCPEAFINAMTGHRGRAAMIDRYDQRTFEMTAKGIVPFIRDMERELSEGYGERGLKFI